MARRAIVEEYRRNYYSGNQARVYFDNQYIGEIVYLEYSISLNKAPIYSYNDPYFKMVAKGNVLVQGNFAINFVEVGYLLKIRNEIQRKKNLATASSRDEMIRTIYTTSGKDGKPYDTSTPEGILNIVSDQTPATRSSMMEWYRDYYWRSIGMDGKPGAVKIHPWEFDYGEGNHIDFEGFKITAIFGVPGIRPGMFSLKTLDNVHVNGESMVVQANGQPLLEQYSFFARNIDEDIANYSDISGTPEVQTAIASDERNTKVSGTDVGSAENIGSGGKPTEQPKVKTGVNDVPLTIRLTNVIITEPSVDHLVARFTLVCDNAVTVNNVMVTASVHYPSTELLSRVELDNYYIGIDIDNNIVEIDCPVTDTVLAVILDIGRIKATIGGVSKAYDKPTSVNKLDVFYLDGKEVEDGHSVFPGMDGVIQYILNN